MTIEKEIDKDLKLAEKKKDKALAEDPSVLKQIKIGLEYRKERALAKLKDKTKIPTILALNLSSTSISSILGRVS